MADVAHLALMDEVAQRRQRLVDVGVDGRPVDLVQVDPVGAQPPQRVLHLADDPAPRAALLVRVGAHRAVELGGQDDVVAATGERLADDLLRLALAVHVGGVDEVDPGVERGVDDADRLLVIRVAPRSEHHGAEAHLADRDAGASQQTLFHWFPPHGAADAGSLSRRVQGAVAVVLGVGHKVAPRGVASCAAPVARQRPSRRHRCARVKQHGDGIAMASVGAPFTCCPRASGIISLRRLSLRPRMTRSPGEGRHPASQGCPRGWAGSPPGHRYPPDDRHGDRYRTQRSARRSNDRSLQRRW